MLISLVRHGAAEEGSPDADRNLSAQGLVQSQTVAKKFKLYAPEVDKAMMSPYQRAKQTAAVYREVFPSLSFEESEAIAPNADVYDLMQVIEQSGNRHLLMVSHNPLLSRLLSLMLDGTTESMRPFPTSKLVCIEMDVIAPGCGELQYTMES
jgi:phosphohistidine phosphatase